MYGDQQVFVAAQLSSTPGYGLTIAQLASILALQGILANPHNGPLTTQECAQKAKDAASALLTLL